jgi:hypothetical protein
LPHGDARKSMHARDKKAVEKRKIALASGGASRYKE